MRKDRPRHSSASLATSPARFIVKLARCAVRIGHVITTQRLHHVRPSSFDSLKKSGVRLNFDSIPSRSRSATVHSVDDTTSLHRLRLIRRPGKLGINHLYAHINGNLNHPLPVGYRGAPTLFIGAGPINHNKWRRFPHTVVARRVYIPAWYRDQL